MPRRNRNAWRNDAEKKRSLAIDVTPQVPKASTRRDRRRAQRAFNNERKAA